MNFYPEERNEQRDCFNEVSLEGQLQQDFELVQRPGGDYYVSKVLVKRDSGVEDIIPILVKNKMPPLHKGDNVKVEGEYRSFNMNGKLVLEVYCMNIAKMDIYSNLNEIELQGYICKKPIYRTTPFGREICDLIVAVNRGYNKTSYIPVIVWGRQGKFISRHAIEGNKVSLSGRIQSRAYVKTLEDGSKEERIAYEVSAGRVSLIQ